jgi:hypothetical protein
MSEQLTKQDLLGLENRLDKKIDKAVTDLSVLMNQFANDVNGRFDKVEK